MEFRLKHSIRRKLLLEMENWNSEYNDMSGWIYAVIIFKVDSSFFRLLVRHIFSVCTSAKIRKESAIKICKRNSNKNLIMVFCFFSKLCQFQIYSHKTYHMARFRIVQMPSTSPNVWIVNLWFCHIVFFVRTWVPQCYYKFDHPCHRLVLCNIRTHTWVPL